jgi:hypothetical protein
MRVLIACEESQRVCTAFREKGHEAYSCDIIDQSGGHPEWHIMQDVLPLINGNCEFETTDGQKHRINGKWDLIIAHPPCTYLTGASAVELSKHPERLQKGFESATFFNSILHADCEKICVENPPPMKRFELPKYSQLIRAYKIGEPHTKAYCLWLKGLTNLKVDETAQKPKAEYIWIHKATGKKKSGSKWYNSDNKNHQLHRSKTPIALAKAMAEQWG